MVMESDSTKDLSALISEITWNFGARGLKGECCDDLSQPEYRTLRMACGQSQCSMQEVAQILGFTKSGVTRVVDRLEKKGYVERKRRAKDGRVCCLEATTSGSKLVNDLSHVNEKRIEKIMAKVDPGMQDVIKAALRSFVKAIKEEG